MDIIDKYKIQYESVMYGPVSSNKVKSILHKYNVQNPLYSQWLTRTGGGPIGPEWFDGVHELEESQKKFNTEAWSIKGFVVGWDGAGNPMVLQPNGEIITEDHNFGGVHLVASSFDTLLAQNVSS